MSKESKYEVQTCEIVAEDMNMTVEEVQNYMGYEGDFDIEKLPTVKAVHTGDGRVFLIYPDSTAEDMEEESE